jgi:hypothetical protein
MVKALWIGKVIADSDCTIVVVRTISSQGIRGIPV